MEALPVVEFAVNTVPFESTSRTDIDAIWVATLGTTVLAFESGEAMEIEIAHVLVFAADKDEESDGSRARGLLQEKSEIAATNTASRAVLLIE